MDIYQKNVPEIQSVTITPAYPNKVNAKASVKIAVSAIDKEIVFQKVLIYAGDGVYAGEQLWGGKAEHNLLTGTKDFSGWGKSSKWTFAEDEDGFTVASCVDSGKTEVLTSWLRSNRIAAKVGQVLTFSQYIKFDDTPVLDDKRMFRVEIYDNNDALISRYAKTFNSITSGKWWRTYAVHTVKEENAAYVRMSPSLYLNGSIHVKKCMVEYGDTLTEYTQD